MRELYFEEGIPYLPKIFELVDRNRLSSTYGCFDRAFWHYRTSDFPSGMYQECVLPLAIVWGLRHLENPYFQQERIRELVWAGIDFARHSSRPDGSCDDYFPYERAAGAAAFSLYACTEACLLLNFEEPRFQSFFKKRASCLDYKGYQESGVLSNHKALIVLCLYNVFLLTQDLSFKARAEKRRDDLLSLQSEEGWFPEYEGCDPGYLSFTIDFLAKYFQKSKDEKVLEPLRKAIEFSSYFLHPDGTLGGEYGSRNTFHFLPHAYELMGNRVPQALEMADRFLETVEKKRRSYLEDDRLFCHYTYNFLQAYQDYTPRKEKTAVSQPEDFTKFFQEAGLLVRRSKPYHAVISSAKAGVAKIFKGDELCWCDSGFVGKAKNGIKFTSAVRGQNKFHFEGNRIVIEGSCYEHRELIFNPLTFVLFRLFLLVIGRFLPANVTRRLLQWKTILKARKKFPLRFKKVFSLKESAFVEYTLERLDPKLSIEELWIGSDATFIYVATSQSYQPGSLKPWINLKEVLGDLNSQKAVVFRREL